jgi:hypothetical protein
MRYSTYLVVLLLPACTVDTPVVEGNTRLGEDLGPWCESLCGTYAECEASPVEETCPADCVAYFTDTFVGKGDVCEKAALRVMDCFDTVSCDDLRVENACNIHTEETRCLADSGQVICDATDSSGQPNGAPLACDMGYSDCSDGKEYRLSCSTPVDATICQCFVDGAVTGTFLLTDAVCPMDNDPKQICGWPIPNGQGEPSLSPPPRCGLIGSSGSGEPGDCMLSFDDCTDGQSYGVTCDALSGVPACRCEINGVSIGFSGSPDAVCPFANGDDDSGAVAVNYACGFNLAPVRP